MSTETSSNLGPKMLLTLPELREILGISRDTAYRLMQTPDFPQPLRLTQRLQWLRVEIEAWVMSRPRGRVSKKDLTDGGEEA
jgi:predicted DNA-binding transcriptional regulator AlpA